MTGSEPWTEGRDGLTLTIRVTPKASRTAFAGTVTLPDGKTALAIRLAAPPVDGAANAELIAFLGKALDLRRSEMAIVAGETSRLKRVRLDGDAAALKVQLAALRL